jgi:hypothetical protein
METRRRIWQEEEEGGRQSKKKADRNSFNTRRVTEKNENKSSIALGLNLHHVLAYLCERGSQGSRVEAFRNTRR